ncbi:ATP-independent RNA helicase dbpA [Blastochloris viridis]|uniref:ATP-independent RNA helicase dbpA n=1 Tax=Blastochloris viridis TaxID=1079 RepID=A0A0S4Q491_BLAVI|nr:ATP-independent RNA helicase dbpA [Blastochloris viridis]
MPEPFRRWFAGRGWAPRPHQLALMDKARAGRSTLLIAPTGAGKTLAGFLPSLAELAAGPPETQRGLHTLYISPLKALAVDIARNLETPVAEIGLPIRIETRTGDTPSSKRQRQRRDPPDILLTTPEQLALLLSTADAPYLFATLKRVVLDELHALVISKRGELLALGLARLHALAPRLQTIGLSATVAWPEALRRYLVPQTAASELADLVEAPPGASPQVLMLDTAERLPWAGHSARHAVGEVYHLIRRHRTTLVFVNTRMQAELVFQLLWEANDDNLPIALHHGSLDVAQRRKVEAAMADGRLKAVVATSSLDLGIDWGDIDLVINVGAPKGASRLIQRIGRANHRLDEPSKAVLVPANRFEVLECRAAQEAVAAGAQDTELPRRGGLDVLAQHILGTACAAPFSADGLFAEVTRAAPYADLSRADFDATLSFAATGGYALKSYERFAKLRQRKDGLWRIANPRFAQQYRLNIGTIVESDLLTVRLVRGRRRAEGSTGPLGRGGRALGTVEESFVETLTAGDSFVFAGEIVAFEAIVEDQVYVSWSSDPEPRIPSYFGGKFPLSTFLAEKVRAMIADPAQWAALPAQVAEWLSIQRRNARLPRPGELMVETFPREGRHYLVAYPFEGRLAHQTLGMLLTRRLERAHLAPLGFVANDYALAVWTRADLSSAIAARRLALGALFDQDMLGDDLEAWLDESALMKRTFRSCAIIAGLIERRHPGKEKSGRQMTMSTDLVFDVLRRHEPDHLLLRVARADAATGLIDLRRLAMLLARVHGSIRHVALEKVSPLAVPVLLEIGREPVFGAGAEELMAENAAELVEEAMR